MAETKQGPALQLSSIDEINDFVVPFPLLAPPKPIPDLLNGDREEYINFGIPLYEASLKGDWEAAKAILDARPELVRYGITENHETALHIAASADKSKRMQNFVKNLVGMMDTTDLELQDNSSNTALCLAAAAGNVEMVKILVKRNRALLVIAGSQQMMPLYVAALFGHHDTVEYLYSESKGLCDDGWTFQNRGWLLQRCVEANLFGTALQIVKDRPELSRHAGVFKVLARKPEALYGTSNILKKFYNWVPTEYESEALQLLRIIWRNLAKSPKKEIDDMLRGQAYPFTEDLMLPYNEDEQMLQILKPISKNNVKRSIETQNSNAGPLMNLTRASPSGNASIKQASHLLFVAAKMGNAKFIVEVIRTYPDLVCIINDNNQSIFHIAVKYRYEGIYNLLYEIGLVKYSITRLRDENDNNMLHLVGAIPRQKRLQDVSGVALQMQRELLWFKEVEAMVPPSYREQKNKQGLTPHELFTEEHKDLLAQGEKWMKETASQCMVVAALIATMVFAAAFTVSGGYNQTTGIPIFHSEITFMVFVIADAISLFASTASILMFLSILTSRYAERDFLQSLPQKLMLGLATLFFSITTMAIAFSVSFFVLYKKGLVWMPITISLFAVMPILLFAWLQYPLLGDVFQSTYGSRYLFKPKKRMLYYETPKSIIMRLFSTVTFGFF